jgi:hypothetical protein
MKTIKLATGRVLDRQIYKIVSVKNSTRYSPGRELEKSEVDHLCESSGWDVTIVSLRQEEERCR